jgi:PAS domain S-box-containing protein
MPSGADPQIQQCRRRRRDTLWLAGALALGAAMLAAFGAWRHAEARDMQEQRLRQQVQLVASLLARELDAVNAALVGLLDDAQAAAGGRAGGELRQRLRSLEAAMAGVRTLSIYDAAGIVRESSRGELVGADFSQRDYFIDARRAADPTRLIVSRPFRTALGVWGVNLVRSVRGEDGRFVGIVAATLDAPHFAALVAPVHYAPDMWGAVAHDSGTLLLMTPPRPGLDGSSLLQSDSMFSRHRASGAVETAYWGRVASTGEERVIVQRDVRPTGVPSDHGLVVALSRDSWQALGRWRAETAFGGALFLLVATLGFAGLGIVHRRERRQWIAQETARAAVRDNEQRWALALESSGVGVWDWNPQTDAMFRSRVWKRMLGDCDDSSAATGAAWLARVHPDDLAALRAALDAHLGGKSERFAVEHRIRAADGRWRWVLDQGRVFARDEADRPVRVVGTQTDIGERREAEALRRERDLADAANRAKTEFLSRMSHELRTPLNAILGFAQLLVARPDPALAPEQREQLGYIEQAGWHVLEMVNDMLDLARIEAGQLELHSQAVALGGVVAAAQAMVARQAQEAQVELAAAPVDAAAVVEADPVRLRQVLVNLLSNAIKYNRKGGRVDIAVEPAGAGWHLRVTDTGLGMNEEQLAHLFEPFNRLGRGQSAIEGTGIGLVVTRWLVEAMGGTIAVRSAPGAGSSFVVRLPPAAPLPARLG